MIFNELQGKSRDVPVISPGSYDLALSNDTLHFALYAFVCISHNGFYDGFTSEDFASLLHLIDEFLNECADDLSFAKIERLTFLCLSQNIIN